MKKNKTDASRKRSGVRLLHTWHRYLGISVAVFVIYLSVTGLLLNHTDTLQLSKKPVHSPALLALYGIENPKGLNGFAVQRHWISAWNNQLFFDQKMLTYSDYVLKGAITHRDFIAVATLEEILLVTLDGQLIERLTAPAEKLGDIFRIGLNEQNFIAIETGQGIFVADADLIAWHPDDKLKITWAEAKPLPEKLFDYIVSTSHSIHWERLLLDLHSGRVAGTFGVVLIDLAAIILIVLALSGVYMWYARGRRLRKQ